MTIAELLKLTVEKDGSDLHLVTDIPPYIRLYGELVPLAGFPPVTKEKMKELIHSMISHDQREKFDSELELDFSYYVEGLGRFRVNFLMEKKGVSAAIRVIPSRIPTPEEVGLPESIIKLTRMKNGLVLVTGPTGTGKSTTLASLINKINEERPVHILTIEDPIEFVYTDKKAIIRQREVGTHTKTFEAALKHAMRQDPNVVLIGEMRDLETIAATLTLAETGHLAFATLHTTDAAQTIDRIIDVFPPHQQQQIRTVLASVLRGVICQQLIPCKGGVGRAVAREVLLCDSGIANLIRDGKTPQIYSAIQTNRAAGMFTMEADVKRLYQKGLISADAALRYVPRPEMLRNICPELQQESSASVTNGNGF